ncbi:MAG: T9SS type A sorting domain-containing protein [Saprospiraceae bacterium]
MKTKNTSIICLLFLASILFSSQSMAQTFNNFDYECLETPLKFYSPNQGNVHIECNAGISTIDTLSDPCYDFYSEDGNILKGWYYIELDANGQINFFFDSLQLHHDSELTGTPSKYFELHRSGFWYSFYEPGNTVEKLSLQVRDISGGGVNFGSQLNVGPEFYASFEDLANQSFPNLSIDYTDEILTFEGNMERLFIGGDHLYIGNLLINETTSSVSNLEPIDFKLYPNPTTTEINLEGKNLPDSQIQIIDLSGKVVLLEKVNSEKWQTNIAALPNGFFWIQVTHNNEITWTKGFDKN